ncbi:rab11 family-interacting protein 4-like [Ascaphus truei]|uniref:rab11 family-interacting protein 4-like n=1 Tax=Ascaphus truei TaxID=8439 RepID=UPI003F5A2181
MSGPLPFKFPGCIHGSGHQWDHNRRIPSKSRLLGKSHKENKMVCCSSLQRKPRTFLVYDMVKDRIKAERKIGVVFQKWTQQCQAFVLRLPGKERRGCACPSSLVEFCPISAGGWNSPSWIHTLEEQIQDEKLLLEEKMRELRAQRDSSFHKAERTWRLEVEKLNTRLKMQQEENSQLSVSVSALSAQNRVLEKKVQALVVELLETADTLEMERPKNRQWEEVLIRERAAWESERQGVAQLVEDLRSELGRLRRSDGAGQCVCPRSRWEESDMEKQRLAEENRGLRELNEELQDAVLTQSGTLIFLQPGVRERNRTAQGSLVHSIADEIEVCTKEQISALNEQKEINRRLRQYLDRVILSVLEKDPALLEIKSTI